MSEVGSDRHDRPLVPPVFDKGSGTPSEPSSVGGDSSMTGGVPAQPATAAETMTVWILSQSDGSPAYDIEGVFATRDLALAAAGGAIHPDAGTLESHGGIGWFLPDGAPAWSEDTMNGSLTTFDMHIGLWPVVGERAT